VPLLVALVEKRAAWWPDRVARPSRSFLVGLTAGAVYFIGTLYWTARVMRVYGDLSAPVAVLVTALFVAYLALYPALFAVVLERLVRSLGRDALLLAPAVWVATELGRAHLLTGFPWALLGYSQATVLPVAQLASLFGVYGLSGLVALVNAAIAYAIVARGRRRAVPIAVALALTGVTAAWGSARMRENSLTRVGVPVRIGLVQGDIAQDQKWDEARAASVFQRYLELDRDAARQGAAFIIWPESSTPFYFEQDPVGADAIRRLVVQTKTYLLFGSDQIEWGQPNRYYNSAFLLAPDGRVAAVYRKMHLVPFGEYVPLKRLLFFVGPLVEAVSDFSPGEQAVLLPVGRHPVSTAICYEVVYPDEIRTFVLGGSQLLTTITNDAWFGTSSAPSQHFEQASMRAIEEGRYLARAANTGVSGIVDPYGRVLARSGLFTSAVLVGEVRFLTGFTVYARIGDLVANLCAFLTALTLLAVIWMERKRVTSERKVSGTGS
jgi:apolipoprotein N-acyltransferase